MRVTENKGVVKAVGAATPAAFSITLYRKYTGLASAEWYDLVRFLKYYDLHLLLPVNANILVYGWTT